MLPQSPITSLSDSTHSGSSSNTSLRCLVAYTGCTGLMSFFLTVSAAVLEVVQRLVLMLLMLI